ncbi:MAG: NAD(P)H-dependent oxidoreductase [Chloroflexota bacterium]
MAKVLIVYHSQGGTTEAMARAVSDGALSVTGANVSLKKATEATADDLLGCDAVAFGTPNYFGYMAGGLKDYFDRTWASLRGRLANKPYATFGSAGSGGKQALDSLEKLLSNFGMKKASDSVITTGKEVGSIFGQCRELGKKLAQL